MTDIDAKVAEISALILKNPSSADLYFQRGKLHWKAGRKAEAMTDFNTALSIDPASPAKAYLDMANEIMDFYNTDLYNP